MPQLFTTIETVSVVVRIEQQTIFRSVLLFLFNNLNIFPMNSNSSSEKVFFRVRQNDRVLSSSSLSSQPWVLPGPVKSAQCRQ